MARRISNSDYVAKYNAIRPYVKIKVSKNPTKSEKAQITKYYKAASSYGLIGKHEPGLFIKRTRSAKVLAAAKKQAGMNDPGLPKFKVAVFHNVPEGSKVKTIRKGGKIRFNVASEFRREENFYFEDYEAYPGEFTKNARKVAERMLPDVMQFDRLRFLNGDSMVRDLFVPELLPDKVDGFVAEYGRENRRLKVDRYSNWLRGVLAISFENQQEKSQYMKTIGKRKKKQSNKKFRDKSLL